MDSNKTNLDSSAFIKITPSLSKQELFKISDKSFSVDDFVKKSKSKGEFRGLGLNREGVKRGIEKIVDPISFDLATANLEKDFKDFASLLKEFKDGILLFKVETSEVFDKLKFDSAAAKIYWEPNQTKYNTLPAYDITEIFVMTDTLANEVYKKAKAGEDFDKLAEQYTQRSGYREKKGSWGRVSIKDNKLAQYANTNKAATGDVLAPYQFEKGYSVIKINKFEPIRQKTFLEAISDLAPEFQDLQQKKLAEKWINSVKEKVEVRVYHDKINEILKNSN
jgi:peptidyl-prolyl cis-trans isomerase SurA